MKGNVFGSILGGVLDAFDAEEVIKQVATQATASVAKAPISRMFQRMNVEGRRALAAKLRTLADHLDAGRCNDAAVVAGDIIDDIKL